jgi:hypothetical protein
MRYYVTRALVPIQYLNSLFNITLVLFRDRQLHKIKNDLSYIMSTLNNREETKNKRYSKDNTVKVPLSFSAFWYINTLVNWLQPRTADAHHFLCPSEFCVTIPTGHLKIYLQISRFFKIYYLTLWRIRHIKIKRKIKKPTKLDVMVVTLLLHTERIAGIYTVDYTKGFGV